MRRSDIVVIGGSAAGIPAALTARQFYPEHSVLLIRREPQALVPCGIPYIFGAIGSTEADLIPDAMLQSAGIDLLVDEVTSIDRQREVLATAGGEEIGYGRLVLGVGSQPVVPPIPGADKANVFAIRKDVAYIERMLAAFDRASRLVIAGCGFIGVELAEENRRERGLQVTIVEMLEHCLEQNYDLEFAQAAEEVLRSEGIDILTNTTVEEIEGNERAERVILSDGQVLPADVVVLALGATANSDLARRAGLAIGPLGGILVNRYQQTSDEHIFAAGDCAEKVSFFDGRPSPQKLASIATTEARIAGANLFALQRANPGTIGVYSTILGGRAFASAGLTERAARLAGYQVITGQAEAINRHPGCMPGGMSLRVKLVFDAATRVLLGGQVMGAESGGEMVNAISACVQERMTADDMALFQAGSHPGLTASPITYQLVAAAEAAIATWLKERQAAPVPV